MKQIHEERSHYTETYLRRYEPSKMDPFKVKIVKGCESFTTFAENPHLTCSKGS